LLIVINNTYQLAPISVIDKSKLLSTNFNTPSVKKIELNTNKRRIAPLIIKTGQLCLFRKGMLFVNDTFFLILNQLTFTFLLLYMKLTIYHDHVISHHILVKYSFNLL